MEKECSVAERLPCRVMAMRGECADIAEQGWTTEGHWAVISARVKVANFMGCMKRGRSENQSQEDLSSELKGFKTNQSKGRIGTVSLNAHYIGR